MILSVLATAHLGAAFTDPSLRPADQFIAHEIIFTRSRVGMAIFDSELRFLAINDALAKINGLPAAAQIGRKISDLFPAHEAAEAISHLQEVIRSGDPRMGVQVNSPQHIAGPRRNFICDYLPVPLSDGSRGVASLVTDVTSETQAALNLKSSEAKLRHVLDSALAQIVLLDLEGRVVLANAPALAAAGLDMSSVQGRPYEEAYWWSYDDHAPLRIRAAVSRAAAGEVVRCRERLRVSPTRFRQVMLQITPVRDQCGALGYLVPSLVDITEEVEAKERQALLAAELNHRVKNILAIVRALVRQSAKRATSKDALAISLEGRISAMARTVAMLNRSDWAGFGLADVFTEQMQHSFADRFTHRGPNLALSPKAALAMSLLAYEFMSNASKYGALSEPGGMVDVAWEAVGPDLVWRWREFGGPVVAPPTDLGFGSLLVRGVAEGDLSGVLTMEYASEGFQADLRAPLDSMLADRAPDDVPNSGKLHEAQVLLAEPAAIVALDMLSVLDAAGGEVLGPAASVAEALALLKANDVTVAAVAERLAQPALLEALRSAGAATVVIGGVGPAPIGCVRLEKPFSDRDFVALLERLIAEKSATAFETGSASSH